MLPATEKRPTFPVEPVDVKEGRPARTTTPAPAYRALAAGVLFSVAYTAVIWLLAGRLADIPHAEDAGASWYYWKLIDPTLASRLTAWGFYLLHQVAFWAVIFYAQRTIGRGTPRYSGSLRLANGLALGVNGFFIALRVVQTHLWYDGLAQDVSIWSSLGSVALMLVWVLLMENPRRGLFFGKKIGFPKRVISVARRYHGYYFAWATVYTLWYHPTEATSGHLIGFLYMFLLLLQGSLFFTRAHVNRWWTLFLEVSVLAHGTLVAIMQGEGMWPMFAFGFGGIFVITQMHGLRWPRWVRGLVLAAYVAGVLAVYGALGWERLAEVVRIPFIDYAAVFALAGLIGGALGLIRLLRPSASGGGPHAGRAA